MKEFIVETSARHVHVTREDLDILYGKDYKLTVKKNLSQPGEFVSEEKVTVKGPKGELKFSILGPERKATQVEVSFTDARNLGLTPPIRESGHLDGACPCTIVGPNGEVESKGSVNVKKRHLHATEADAKELGVTNGEIVKVAVDSPDRKVIFDDVVVRVSDKYSLAMHLDTDEANAVAYGAQGKGHIFK